MPLPLSYVVYMQSSEWQARRQAALKYASYRCQLCNRGRKQGQIKVHHRTYDRFGHENPSDLTVLCRDCHDLFHAHRHVKRPQKKNWSAARWDELKVLLQKKA